MKNILTTIRFSTGKGVRKIGGNTLRLPEM